MQNAQTYLRGRNVLIYSLAARKYSQLVSFARVQMTESKPAVFVEDVELFSIQIAQANGSA